MPAPSTTYACSPRHYLPYISRYNSPYISPYISRTEHDVRLQPALPAGVQEVVAQQQGVLLLVACEI